MRIKNELKNVFMEALRELALGTEEVPLILEKPRLKEHGDIATPIALTLGKALRTNPMDLAERIVQAARFPADLISGVEVAKPGFINLTIASGVLQHNLVQVLSMGDRYGSARTGNGRKCQVEYISANPTGPLVIVSARAAAIGSALVNLLSYIGYAVDSEYYVNDYGKQIEALGESVRYRLRERLGKLDAGEEIGAYPGDYLQTIAEDIEEAQALRWSDPAGGVTLAHLGKFASERLLAEIKEDLKNFNVHFDSFFYESSLHPDRIANAQQTLENKGYTYEQDGALYFSSSRLGDEKDRVLRKRDGDPTYFLGDTAYHLNKLERGYDFVIDLWGPDHHGHIPRMKAAAEVMGAPANWLEILIVGWVRILEGDKQVSMSKRAGEFVTMRELIEDVGCDVAKYFFLMRRANAALDFDLELARKQSEENPVYYVQYAHARISSVIRFAKDKGVTCEKDNDCLKLLTSEEERALMLHLMFFSYVVEAAALTREPHRLTVYAQELATLFHQFYHERRIVSEDRRLSSARLLLAEATMQVLRNTMALLGVGAPSSM